MPIFFNTERSEELEIYFPAGSVPVRIAARVYGKDPAWVRAGIITGYLPIGHATRKGQQVFSVSEISTHSGRIAYYISPEKLYKDTGFIWKGEKTWEQVLRRNLISETSITSQGTDTMN